MRLNKMRLAAAMMSAVMAASTMSTAVYAEDLIVDEDVVTVVSEGVAVDEIVEDQIELAGTVNVDLTTALYNPITGILSFDDDSSEHKHYEIKDGVDDATVTVLKVVTKATCTQKGLYQISASWAGFTIDGKNVQALALSETGRHDFEDQEPVWKTTKTATCTATGEETQYKLCNVCEEYVVVNDENGNPVTREIPMGGHEFAVAKTEYKVGIERNTVLGDDGKPALYDETKDGTYDMKVTKVCGVCGQDNVEITNGLTLYSKVNKVFHHAEITLTDNIVNYIGELDTDNLQLNELDLLKDEDFELNNCQKSGKYKITEYYKISGTSTIVSGEPREVTVKAHHTGKIDPIGIDEKNKELLSVVHTTDGKTVVTSKSCHEEAKYREVTSCTSCKKVLGKSEVMTAPATGKHQNNISWFEGNVSYTLASKIAQIYQMSRMMDGLTNDTNLPYVDVLFNYLETYKKYLTVTKNFTCEEGGTITVTVLCEKCGEPMPETTKAIEIAKINHKAETTATKENIVPATCAAEGSFDLVKRCVYCGEVVDTETVKIPKLDHTFEENKAGLSIELLGDVVIDSLHNYEYENGDYRLAKGQKIRMDNTWGNWDHIGVSVNYGVTPKPYDTCTVCGEKEYYHDDKMVIEIVDLVNDDGKGNPGSITLNVTYTTTVDGKLKVVSTGDVTFDYYRDLVSYLTKNPDKAINGLHLDNDGVWRYYENSVCQKDYAGIVKYMGAEFFVANGVKCADANGLNLYDGKWYMLVDGQIARGYTDLALYNGEWFYLVDGELDVTNNGLVEYNGSKFALAAGRLLSSETGLWQNPQDSEWYYLAEGRVVNYTGTTSYNGVTFKLVDGKIVG